MNHRSITIISLLLPFKKPCLILPTYLLSMAILSEVWKSMSLM